MPRALFKRSGPSVLVVDASVVAPIVADGGSDGDRLRARVRGEVLSAPDLLPIEVLSVLRRQLRLNTITSPQASLAVDDLMDLPIEIYPTKPLLGRAWDLRNNITAYDACYVSLAESLNCPLLTADARLARAPTVRCAVETI